MNHWIFFILILCAFGLYGKKAMSECNNHSSWHKQLEATARKALRFTLMGSVAIGCVCLALFAFPLISRIGYELFSVQAVDLIRALMDLLLDTRSVYMAIEILLCAMLLAVELGFIFSIVGFFAVKKFVFPQRMEYDRMQKAPESQSHAEVAIPRKFRKIFLTFANLRI